MPDQTFRVHPINQLHALWWDAQFIVASGMQMTAARGGQPLFRREKAAVNYDRFRSFLLGLHSRPDDKISEGLVDDFMPPFCFELPTLRTIHHVIPLILAGWQRHSRCHFRLTPELQAILREISYDGLRWGDILHDRLLQLRPYKSFSLEFSEPIGMVPGRNYNFITVTTVEEPGQGPKLLIHAFEQRLQAYSPLTKAEIEQMTQRCQNRRHSTWFGQRAIERGNLIDSSMFVINIPKQLALVREQPIQETAIQGINNQTANVQIVGELPAELNQPLQQEEIDRIVRAVVGFCFYIDTLDSGDPNLREDRQPRYNGPVDRRRVITDQSQIFDVVSSIQLTPQDREELGLDGHAVPRGRRALYNWHFRRGHKRRLPGHGVDQRAEKSVKVRAAIVRTDLAITPGVPGGRIVEL